MRVNKRGQGTSTSAIVAMVLGIIAMGILIYYLVSGGSAFGDRIGGQFSSSNVELRLVDCENDCSSGEDSSWCYEKKDLNFFKKDIEKIVKIKGTCSEFYSGNLGEDYKEYGEDVKGLEFKNCTKFSC